MPKPGKSTPSSGSARLAVVILAAGKGTRLKSKHPKVLHEIGGKPLVAPVIAAARQLASAKDIFVIIGHEAERVREAVAASGVGFVVQAEQRGTGHAIQVAREKLAAYEHVLVLSGDVPLIRTETLDALRRFHFDSGSAMTILTTEPPDPTGYGRVLRKSARSSEVTAIVEQKALNARQQAGRPETKLREINAGIYMFQVAPLLEHVGRLTTNNAHGEFYLTDMAALLVKARRKVTAWRAGDATEVLGVNTRAELAQLDSALRRRKCDQLMAAGVTIYRPETCTIDTEVEVGTDTVLEPFVQLLGATRVGADCRIRSHSILTDSVLEDGVEVRPGCILEQATVESRAILGPYARLRPGSEIGAGAHVGNFVETKKARLGAGAKANHLSYLGDADIGAGANVGAGTITCNYDGAQKHRTIIEEGAFIGSDATLVAPVKIGKGAYVGAGSCITEDVPADALAIGRGRQFVKEGWAREKRAQRATAKKATAKKSSS